MKLATFLAVGLLPVAALAQGTVVARVGDRPILRAVLEENVQRQLNSQYFHAKLAGPALNELRKQELARLVERELCLWAGLDRGWKLPAKEAAAEAKRVEEQLGKAEYERSLAARGWTRKDHQRVLAETMLAERACGELLAGAGEVSEEEARAFFQQHRERFQLPEARHLWHILVAVPSTADAKVVAEKEKLAKDLLRRLREGASFAELARQHSADPYRVKGGDLGWVHRGRLLPELEDAAFRAQLGALLGPIRSSQGFHILKVLDHRQPRPMTYEEAKPTILAELARTKQDQARKALFSAVRQRHPVVILDAELADAQP